MDDRRWTIDHRVWKKQSKKQKERSLSLSK